jgi:hypothetical protein
LGPGTPHISSSFPLGGSVSSCDEDASASGLLDSFLSGLGEELSLHNDWDLWESSFAEDLEISLINTMLKKPRSILFDY